MEKVQALEEVLRGTLELLETSPERGKYEAAAEKVKALLLRSLVKFDWQRAG